MAAGEERRAAGRRTMFAETALSAALRVCSPGPPRPARAIRPATITETPSQPMGVPKGVVSPPAPPPPPSSKSAAAAAAVSEEELLRLLECPVCMEAMSAPIELCVNGHSVCAACRRRLQRCPECKGTYAGARCRRLEDIVDRVVARACRFAARGCTLRRQGLQGEELAAHEAACAHRPVACMVCTERVSADELERHVAARHPRNVATDGAPRTVHHARPDAFSYFLLPARGALFWLWRRHGQRFCCLGVDAVAAADAADCEVALSVAGADGVSRFEWAGPVHGPQEHEPRALFAPCAKCALASSAFMAAGCTYAASVRRK